MTKPVSYLLRIYAGRDANHSKVAAWLQNAKDTPGVDVPSLVVATLARGIDASDAPPGNGHAAEPVSIDLAAIRQVFAAELETQLSRYALSGQAPSPTNDSAGDMGDVLAGMLIQE
jgi:hypothetical protein